MLMAHEISQRTTGRFTLGGDRGYDKHDLVATLREMECTPHIMQSNANNRRSAIDGRTTRHEGYEVSLHKHWLAEKPFGWLEDDAGLRQVKLRGLDRVSWVFVFSCAAFNLWRLPKLEAKCTA